MKKLSALLGVMVISSLAVASDSEQGITVIVNEDSATAESLRNLQPYPVPEKGQKRVVIHLPEESDESGFMVELAAGRTLRLDCNYHMLTGEVRNVNIEGWGFTRYVAKVGKDLMSSLMACGGLPLADKFVLGAKKLIRYNSRLPIVVYTDRDVEVRYRVWKATLDFSLTE